MFEIKSAKLHSNYILGRVTQFHLRTHWTSLTRSMTSSSIWWDLQRLASFDNVIIRVYQITITIVLNLICRWTTFCGIPKRVKAASSDEVFLFFQKFRRVIFVFFSLSFQKEHFELLWPRDLHHTDTILGPMNTWGPIIGQWCLYEALLILVDPSSSQGLVEDLVENQWNILLKTLLMWLPLTKQY